MTPTPRTARLPLLLAVLPLAAQANDVGSVTRKTSDPAAIREAACEFMSDAALSGGGGKKWTKGYINNGDYCAASADVYRGGAGCGLCYALTYDGEGGGTSTVVQVVDLLPGGKN